MSNSMDQLSDGIAKVKDGDLFYTQYRTLRMKAFKDEIASFTESDDQWVGARVIQDSKLGTAFTERIEPEAIERVAQRAGQNAAFADADPGNVIYDGSDNPTGEYDSRKGSLDTLSVDAKKEMTLAAEKTAKAFDHRIVNVPYCFYSENDGEYAIATSAGIRKRQQVSSSLCFISVMAVDGEETQTGSEFVVVASPDQLDMNEAAKVAAGRAIAKLGAREIDSGEFPVVFDYTTASELLGAFIASPVSPFFGENIQKGRSMLAGKLGERIGSDYVTIIDDPMRGLSPSYFDGDGVRTAPLTMVDHGVFSSVVHNVYSAAREDGAQTTGHASRTRGGVGTGLHNPYLENGSGSLDDLVTTMGSGILVTEIAGLHAGLNPVTGDFSLSAKGFWINGGNSEFPVTNVVVAGNFFELASRLVGKAADLHDDTRGGFDSPSVMIEKLSVSGK